MRGSSGSTRQIFNHFRCHLYELVVSASAVVQQVSLLQLSSADALFTQVAGVVVAGLNLLVEEWASSTVLGEPLVYRLLLRTAGPQSVTVES